MGTLIRYINSTSNTSKSLFNSYLLASTSLNSTILRNSGYISNRFYSSILNALENQRPLSFNRQNNNNRINLKFNNNTKENNSNNSNKSYKPTSYSDILSIQKTLTIVGPKKQQSNKRYDAHKAISFHSSQGVIQSYQERMKQYNEVWREMQIDSLNEKEYNRPIAESLFKNRNNVYSQSSAKQQQQQQQSPNKLNTEQIENLKNVSLLFGKDILEESRFLDFSNQNELSENTAIEFLDQDTIRIGIITSTLSKDLKVTYLDIDHNNDENTKLVTNHQISKRSVIGSLPLDKISIKPKDLLQFEKKYKFKYENLINIYRYLNNVLDIFRNPIYKFSTYEAAKILFTTTEPTSLDCYMTHRILSTDPSFSVNYVRGGYRVVEQTLELMNDFIQRVKIFSNAVQLEKQKQSQQASIIHLPSSSQDQQQPVSFFDYFKYTDYQYINLLRLYLHYPREKHYPFKQFLQLILQPLNLQMTHANVKQLLQSLGFQLAVDRRELNLFTQQTHNHVSQLLKLNSQQKNNNEVEISSEYKDPLASVRVDFDLPAFAIDPTNIVGAEDAFSIDFKESNDKQIVFYIHTLDVARWVKPHDILFKNSMLTQATHYFENSSYPMLPIDFVKAISFSVSNNQSFSITQKFVVDRETTDIISNEIIPTKLTNITQLSFHQANEIISKINEMPESSMSEGHLILKELAKLAHTRNQNKDLSVYGRKIRAKKLINQKTGTISKIDHQSLESAHILNTILTFADEGYTLYFKNNRIPSFYKSVHSFMLYPISKSFTMATTPIRNFIHLVSQIQIQHFLLSKKPAFTLQDMKQFGYSVLEAIETNVFFKKNLILAHNLNLIENGLLEKMKNSLVEKEGIKPKPLKSRSKIVAKNQILRNTLSLEKSEYIGELVAEIKTVSKRERAFNLYFKEFDYQQNDVPVDQARLDTFKVGDTVKIKVKSVDYDKLILDLEW